MKSNPWLQSLFLGITPRQRSLAVRAFSVNPSSLLGSTTVPIIFMSTIFVLSVMFGLAVPAFAGLGEDASSVQADQAHVLGTLKTTQTQAYTVNEIQASTGTVVREYVSATSGKVFGVAWQGAWPPDMRQVLASYFAQYQQAAQAQANSRAGRHPLMIALPGLVVESGGHMRSFVGRAYVPGSVPQGVSAEAVR
jgi:hypothetical protein